MPGNLMCPYCFDRVDRELLDRNVYCSYDARRKEFIHTWHQGNMPGKSWERIWRR